MKKNRRKLALTGGGTAGHVTPHLALIPKLRERGYEIIYIGSYDGIEKRLIADFDVPYFGISTGKLRRYFDPQNFSDPFRVMKGCGEAFRLLSKEKPALIFSKGGFVSVPVVRSGALLRIPCILHESDMTPGLANRICIPVAKTVCCNFPETLSHVPADKAILTGTPIREELLNGSVAAGKKLCGFTDDKPVLMVVGGSSGAQSVNEVVREALPKLLPEFNVVHICGKEKMDNLMLTMAGYKQFEYVKNELKDLFAMADLVVSRAGANAICELLALKKPNVLIPLPLTSSRGDQILNAHSFERQGFSEVIESDALDAANLLDKIHEVYQNRDRYIETMRQSNQHEATETILNLIDREMEAICSA